MNCSIYEKYLELKKENSDKLYLFKIGLFYDFIDEVAIKISKITTLKLINHSKDILKCGFPENSLDKYMDIFNNIGINVVIVNDNNLEKENNDLEKYLNKIKNIDINNITPVDSMKILCELKELL